MAAGGGGVGVLAADAPFRAEAAAEPPGVALCCVGGGVPGLRFGVVAREHPCGGAGHFHAAQQFADFLLVGHRRAFLRRTLGQIAAGEPAVGGGRGGAYRQPGVRAQRPGGVGVCERHGFGGDAGAVDGVCAQNA